MKNSFYILAATMAMAMLAGIATADSVDIGLGRMDRVEFETLRQMVGGDYEPSGSVSTEIPRETRIAEFNQSDVDAIRQAMVAGSSEQMATASVSHDNMVDIGTGAMTTSEFCNLNKLVASNNTNQNNGFTFICP